MKLSQNQSPEAIKVKLNELYEDAKNKGTITRDEVANQLMEMEIDADQMNKIYETLESMGVDVVAEFDPVPPEELIEPEPVSYTHLRAHETGRNLVCRLLLEKKKDRKNAFCA